MDNKLLLKTLNQNIEALATTLGANIDSVKKQIFLTENDEEESINAKIESGLAYFKKLREDASKQNKTFALIKYTPDPDGFEDYTEKDLKEAIEVIQQKLKTPTVSSSSDVVDQNQLAKEALAEVRKIEINNVSLLQQIKINGIIDSLTKSRTTKNSREILSDFYDTHGNDPLFKSFFDFLRTKMALEEPAPAVQEKEESQSQNQSASGPIPPSPEIPMAPPIEAGNVPSAPPIEAGGVPPAPPIEEGVPLAPLMDIPPSAGIVNEPGNNQPKATLDAIKAVKLKKVEGLPKEKASAPNLGGIEAVLGRREGVAGKEEDEEDTLDMGAEWDGLDDNEAERQAEAAKKTAEAKRIAAEKLRQKEAVNPVPAAAVPQGPKATAPAVAVPVAPVPVAPAPVAAKVDVPIASPLSSVPQGPATQPSVAVPVAAPPATQPNVGVPVAATSSPVPHVPQGPAPAIQPKVDVPGEGGSEKPILERRPPPIIARPSPLRERAQQTPIEVIFNMVGNNERDILNSLKELYEKSEKKHFYQGWFHGRTRDKQMKEIASTISALKQDDDIGPEEKSRILFGALEKVKEDIEQEKNTTPSRLARICQDMQKSLNLTKPDKKELKKNYAAYKGEYPTEKLSK